MSVLLHIEIQDKNEISAFFPNFFDIKGIIDSKFVVDSIEIWNPIQGHLL